MLGMLFAHVICCSHTDCTGTYHAQPAIVFAGEGFEREPALQQAKSLLLDFFRGREVSALSLKVLRAAAPPPPPPPFSTNTHTPRAAPARLG